MHIFFWWFFLELFIKFHMQMRLSLNIVHIQQITENDSHLYTGVLSMFLGRFFSHIYVQL